MNSPHTTDVDIASAISAVQLANEFVNNAIAEIDHLCPGNNSELERIAGTNDKTAIGAVHSELAHAIFVKGISGVSGIDIICSGSKEQISNQKTHVLKRKKQQQKHLGLMPYPEYETIRQPYLRNLEQHSKDIEWRVTLPFECEKRCIYKNKDILTQCKLAYFGAPVSNVARRLAWTCPRNNNRNNSSSTGGVLVEYANRLPLRPLRGSVCRISFHVCADRVCNHPDDAAFSAVLDELLANVTKNKSDKESSGQSSSSSSSSASTSASASAAAQVVRSAENYLAQVGNNNTNTEEDQRTKDLCRALEKALRDVSDDVPKSSFYDDVFPCEDSQLPLHASGLGPISVYAASSDEPGLPPRKRNPVLPYRPFPLKLFQPNPAHCQCVLRTPVYAAPMYVSNTTDGPVRYLARLKAHARDSAHSHELQLTLEPMPTVCTALLPEATVHDSTTAKSMASAMAEDTKALYNKMKLVAHIDAKVKRQQNKKKTLPLQYIHNFITDGRIRDVRAEEVLQWPVISYDEEKSTVKVSIDGKALLATNQAFARNNVYRMASIVTNIQFPQLASSVSLPRPTPTDLRNNEYAWKECARIVEDALVASNRSQSLQALLNRELCDLRQHHLRALCLRRIYTTYSAAVFGQTMCRLLTTKEDSAQLLDHEFLCGPRAGQAMYALAGNVKDSTEVGTAFLGAMATQAMIRVEEARAKKFRVQYRLIKPHADRKRYNSDEEKKYQLMFLAHFFKHDELKTHGNAATRVALIEKICAHCQNLAKPRLLYNHGAICQVVLRNACSAAHALLAATPPTTSSTPTRHALLPPCNDLTSVQCQSAVALPDHSAMRGVAARRTVTRRVRFQNGNVTHVALSITIEPLSNTSSTQECTRQDDIIYGRQSSDNGTPVNTFAFSPITSANKAVEFLFPTQDTVLRDVHANSESYIAKLREVSTSLHHRQRRTRELSEEIDCWLSD